MSDIHELTLREYYESFAQSLKDEIEEEEEMSIEYFEPEVIYLEYLEGETEEYAEVIEILNDSDVFNCSMETVHKSPEKLVKRLKVQHPKIDPLKLGKSKSFKAFHRNEDDHITRRITRSSKLL